MQHLPRLQGQLNEEERNPIRWRQRPALSELGLVLTEASQYADGDYCVIKHSSLHASHFLNIILNRVNVFVKLFSCIINKND